MREVVALLILVAALAVGAPALAQVTPDQPAPPTVEQIAQARQALLDGRYAEALAISIPGAQAGNAAAQNLLGVAYDDGLGISTDPLAALMWYTRAAEQGNGPAQMNLAQIFRDGRPGIAINPTEARRWMQAASEGGYGPAHAGLGYLLQHGIGGPVDVDQARVLYERGHATSDPWASEYLAHLYLTGIGVERDEARARELFAEASDHNIVQATGNLAYMMEMGMGGPQDLVQAESLYQQAIASGNALAAYNLAWMYSDQATTSAEYANAAQTCQHALELGTEEERSDWAIHCMDLSKWAAAPN